MLTGGDSQRHERDGGSEIRHPLSLRGLEAAEARYRPPPPVRRRRSSRRGAAVCGVASLWQPRGKEQRAGFMLRQN
jgi:hypothetical protein